MTPELQKAAECGVRVGERLSQAAIIEDGEVRGYDAAARPEPGEVRLMAAVCREYLAIVTLPLDDLAIRLRDLAARIREDVYDDSEDIVGHAAAAMEDAANRLVSVRQALESKTAELSAAEGLLREVLDRPYVGGLKNVSLPLDAAIREFLCRQSDESSPLSPQILKDFE